MWTEVAGSKIESVEPLLDGVLHLFEGLRNRFHETVFFIPWEEKAGTASVWGR